jgi:DNA-binding XRE family transcriptional regulator
LEQVISKPKNIKYIENPKNLGDKIKNKRLELGITQGEAANSIGASRSATMDWENGIGEPTIDFYPAIISFLGYIPFEFDKSKLSDRLREYRFLNGLSQEVLGKKIGIGGATIHRIEQGKSKMNNKTTKALKTIIEI